ncbi:MAG: hypothetical protein PHG23_01870, partial [Candidatus Pacebacteria bacterium]|nr:hypothetical protein [Candidatus Paceibacterota bacterium]
ASWVGMSYSKEVLKLEILGQDKIDAGEQINYTVKFKNNGKVRLETPELYFEFPDGAILENTQKIVKMDSKALGGDIYPGEERSFTFSARLLGQEGETKTAKARINFQPKDLKSRNETSTTFTTILGKIPLSLFIETPDQVPSGKSITVRVSYSSNVSYPLSDLTVKVETPTDFKLQYSQPKGLDNEWSVPILNQAEKKSIQLTGTLSGESKDQKIFKAQIGIWQGDNFIMLEEVARGVEIIAPSIYVTQKVNGNENYTASTGDQLHYEITFTNIGDEPLNDLVLISRLAGSGIDFNSVRVMDGNYQQGDNSIVWDSAQLPALKYLDVGQQAKVEFWVKLNSRWTIASTADKNPVIRNSVSVGPAKQDFVTKINSALVAEQKIYNENQYFTNSGPFPLQVGQKTYLTVEWTAKNFYNDVEGARIRGILPPGVDFENAIYPSDAKITFNVNTREIIWEIGSLEAGAGFLTGAKKAAFQVSAIPEFVEDVLVVGDMQLSGNDQWTGRELSARAEALYAPVANTNNF